MFLNKHDNQITFYDKLMQKEYITDRQERDSETNLLGYLQVVSGDPADIKILTHNYENIGFGPVFVCVCVCYL